ncbi:hypothetical protein SLEP1_g1672 [Rubroshorea leprosula]|uniref:Uncharacterized protein n=1 Tax=Rubroshorea leprosula TaxID=152421 RepID=A0AAV5HEJ3_9ROSI|nr:hypothetical protein SLEP1_g1672 [Rubroshorea leprosula]
MRQAAHKMEFAKERMVFQGMACCVVYVRKVWRMLIIYFAHVR